MMLINGRSPGLLRASPHPSSISSPPLGPLPPAREYRYRCIEGEPAVSDRTIIMIEDGDSSLLSLCAPALHPSPIPIPLHRIGLLEYRYCRSIDRGLSRASPSVSY